MMARQHRKFKPKPSRSYEGDGPHSWAHAMKESGVLISAILSVAHPALFRAGQAAMRTLAGVDTVSHALASWPTVFDKVHLICNRESPYHRDSSGLPTWYDLIMTLGSYRWGTLALRNLGVQVSYRPGTIALISAYLIHHGVGPVGPDWICYSWFMCKEVHQNHGVEDVPWMTLSNY